MSTDNMLAVAGASGGAWERILFGLGLSIPIIMFCSGIIANLIDRYPVLADIGAGILGWTGGEMIVHDAWVKPWLGTSLAWVKWVLPAFCTVGVISLGRGWSRLKTRAASGAETKKEGVPASPP